MNVFNYYNGGSPQPTDPLNNTETYRVLEGKWRLGDSWITPSGDTTRKCYTGDPVTGTGWLMPGENDRKFLQSFGPFNMNPNDTQSIIVAQLIAKNFLPYASLYSTITYHLGWLLINRMKRYG